MNNEKIHFICTMKNDWIVLKNFFNFCYYFSVTPFHSENSNKPVKKLHKLYVFLLVFVVTCQHLYEIWLRRTRANVYIKQIGVFFDAGHIILEIAIFNATIIASNIIYSENWTKIFHRINNDYEVYFNDKLFIHKRLRLFYFEFIFPFLIVTIIEIMDMVSTKPFSNELKFIGTRINIIYVALFIVLFYHFLLYFKTRYNCLNLYLQHLIKHRMNGRHDISEIKYLRKIYQKMNESVVKLNEIFGSFTFIYVIYFVVRNIYWIFIATHPYRTGNLYYYVVLIFLVYNWVKFT